MEVIKPPFNYTGNKNKLIETFKERFFPKQRDLKFLDLFGGGSSVSINVDYTSITYNEVSPWPMKLLPILEQMEKEEVLAFFKTCIEYYGFTSSYYKLNMDKTKKDNELPFNKMRADLNQALETKPNDSKTWLGVLFLSFYSFNNDIRFNSKGRINIPFGKSNYGAFHHHKMNTYTDALKAKKVIVSNRDFRDIDINQYDFVYADPPYINSVAVYNENGGWGRKQDDDLMLLLENYSTGGGRFAMSNLSIVKSIPNDHLVNWAKHNGFRIIELSLSYKNSSYHKNRDHVDQEIIITNIKEEDA